VVVVLDADADRSHPFFILFVVDYFSPSITIPSPVQNFVVEIGSAVTDLVTGFTGHTVSSTFVRRGPLHRE
jgi:hypothetical protein